MRMHLPTKKHALSQLPPESQAKNQKGGGTTAGQVGCGLQQAVDLSGWLQW